MMDVVVTTGTIRCARLQLNRYHQQTQHTCFYRLDALPVAKPTVSLCTTDPTLSELVHVMILSHPAVAVTLGPKRRR